SVAEDEVGGQRSGGRCSGGFRIRGMSAPTEENSPAAPKAVTGPTSAEKPRAWQVTDGYTAAPARGMLRAVGMGDDDWSKAQIGIASSWNEITPCNLSLDRLAQA